jgi:hypothetical protein
VRKPLIARTIFLLWLAYCVGSLLWFLHLPKSGGCDGGMCLFGPIMLVYSWGVVGLGLAAPFVVVEVVKSVFETLKSIRSWFKRHA